MKIRILGAAALITTAVLAVTAGPASAHSADVRAECHKGKPMAAVHLSNYNGTNTVSLTNDGAELTPGTFGSSYDAQFDLGDPTVSHLVVYSIVANDDPDNAAGFSPHGTLTVPACQAPPTTEAPPVTEAPTTTATPVQVIRLVRASCLSGIGAGLRISIYNPIDVSYTVAYDGVIDPAYSVTVPANTLDQRVIRWTDPLGVHTYSVTFSDGDVQAGSFPGPCPVTTPVPSTSTTAPPVVAVDVPPTVPSTVVTSVVPEPVPAAAIVVPAPVPAPVAPVAPSVAPSLTELPSTGSTSTALVVLASVLLAAGVAAIAVARRRAA